jgi:hypothetical protein
LRGRTRPAGRGQSAALEFDGSQPEQRIALPTTARTYFNISPGTLMKSQFSIAIAMASLLAAGAASAQNGNMMNGGNWGGTWMGGTWMDGYGGIWMVVLMVVVVAAIIGWIVSQNKK